MVEQQLTPELEALWQRMLRWLVEGNKYDAYLYEQVTTMQADIADLKARKSLPASEVMALIEQAVQKALDTRDTTMLKQIEETAIIKGMVIGRQQLLDEQLAVKTQLQLQQPIAVESEPQSEPQTDGSTGRTNRVRFKGTKQGTKGRKTHAEKERMVLDFYTKNTGASLEDGVKALGIRKPDVSAIRMDLRKRGLLT